MKILIIFTAVLMLSPALIKAQSPDPELDYIKKAYSKDKKEIVDQYMGLDVQEGAKFWPVYGEYEKKREKLAVERVKIIEDYVEHSDSISSVLADKAASAALANSISLDQLNFDYYRKMRKAIGAINAAKFVQLEIYLQTSWRVFVQDNIPLIGELDKTQKH